MNYSKIHQYIERRKRIRERDQRRKERALEKELERKQYFSNFKLPTLDVARSRSPSPVQPNSPNGDSSHNVGSGGL